MDHMSREEHIFDQTETALKTFYHALNAQERQAAHKWLIDVQNSPEGWQLAWKLIMNSSSTEVLYFGASLIHYKISRFWKEIPEDQYLSIRADLVKLIGRYATVQKMVMSKLCQALSAFLINAAPEFWLNSVEQSVCAIQDATQIYQEHESTMAVIEFLTTLADEFNSTTLAPTRKGTVRPELQEYVPDIVRIFLLILKSGTLSSIKVSVLKSLSSWIGFGLSLEDCDVLLPFLFGSLSSIDLVDCIVDVLSDLISSPSCYNLENAVYNFMQRLVVLEELLLKSIQDSNTDLVNGICKIIVCTGESHSRRLINPKNNEEEAICISLVKMVLHCTGIPGQYPVDETCSESTFSFWYALQDELMTIDSDSLTTHQKGFFGAFMSLLHILFKKVQFPKDEIYCEFEDDEKEQFRCYRHDVQDTVMYIYNFLGEQCLHHLVELLKYLLSGQATASWMEIEGVLFLIQGVAEYVEVGESTYMPQVFSLLQSLPSHPRIADRAILMVGAFSEWLQGHPQQLLATLPLLQSGLLQKEMASSCSLAIRDICRECAQSLPEPNARSLLESCRQSLSVPSLTDREKTRCVESFGYVVSVQQPSLLTEEMNLMNQYLLQEFNRLFSIPVNKTTLEQLKFQLHYFAALFRTVDPVAPMNPHPLLCTCHTLQPRLKQLISRTMDEETVNSLVTCVSKALENVREGLSSEITDIAELLLTVFTNHSYESILDVSATLVCLFAPETHGGDAARALFHRLSELCVERIERGEFNSNPGCIQSFFDFIARVLRTAADLILDDRQLQFKVIQCCLHVLHFQEKPTIKSACNFLVNYSAACAKDEEKSDLFKSVGQSIVSTVLLCVAGRSPRTAVEFLADVFFVLNKNYITLLATWLKNCLSQEGFPSHLATAAAKEQFQKVLLREKVNKRRLRDLVNEFSLLCRGLYGTAYANS